MPLQIRTSANGAPRALLLTQSAQTAPALIGDLAAWGGQQVIAEARRRFTRFSAARATLSPDDQMMVLSIVGPYEDAATFEQLHSMARQAKDDASRRRFYLALASARDPKLAEQAAQIALDPEIPAQAIQLRLEMVLGLHNQHPQLAWSTFSAHADMLLSPIIWASASRLRMRFCRNEKRS